MVNYKCPRCGFETIVKTKYIQHLKRKFLCKSTLSENNLGEEYKKYNISEKMDILENPGESSVNPCESSVNPGESSVNPGESSVNPGEILFIQSNHEKKLICKYCNKSFKRKDYLENHLKKSCKMLKEFNNIYIFNKKTFGSYIYKNYKNAGDIYIIQTDYINKDHYKIGITNNIQKRLRNYRCGNTYEPRLHYYISCQDIKLVDNILKTALAKNNVKREIFQGDVEDLKNIIIEVVKKKFNLNKVYVYEPEIKLGDLAECIYCNKYFYNKKDLFEHFNSCTDYREILNKKKIYECKYCEKSLSSYKSLWRHYKICREKQDEEEKQKLLDLVDLLNKQIEKKDKQIEKKDKQIDELIKKAGINVGTQNIQNQINQEIKILAYNDTDISHLTDSDYLKCIKHANFCIPNLIKQIHFNPTKPENHNIYISNLKNNYVMIYDGNKWLIRDRDDSIQDIIDKNEGIIEQKIEEWIENGKDYPDIMKKFNKYLEKKENDKVLNKIKSEIKLMLFNNRDMISTV